MNKINFFIRHIFLKKWILVLGLIMVILMTNLLFFTTIRSLISTYVGNQDNQFLYQDNLFISNMDPYYPQDFSTIEKKQSQGVYDFLANHTDYAIEVYGWLIELDNQDAIDVGVHYINERAYELKDFGLSKGNPIEFDQQKNKEVLIGAGLAKDYHVGESILFTNPVTEKQEEVTVKGILNLNETHSNYYAPNSKTYLNYSIIYPIDESFIAQSHLDLQINALNDLILINSTPSQVEQLKHIIKTKTGLLYNFYSQEENLAHFEEYYSVAFYSILSIALFVAIIGIILAIWINASAVQLSIQAFTLNLLLGLSFPQLKIIFYQYLGLLFSITLMLTIAFFSMDRYAPFLANRPLEITLGFLHLSQIDWLTILILIVLNALMVIIITESVMHKIRKTPISVGVLS